MYASMPTGTSASLPSDCDSVATRCKQLSNAEGRTPKPSWEPSAPRSRPALADLSAVERIWESSENFGPYCKPAPAICEYR